MAIDTNKIPEYNKIDYENDDLSVQRAKQEAINRQFANEDNDQKTTVKANAADVTNTNNDDKNS